MKTVSLIIFAFFSVLSVLIYLTKNYQYEKYMLETKSDAKILYLVNLNLATWHDFASLPGISDQLAKNIVTNRDSKGRFAKVEDILRVKGIGKEKFEKIKKYLTLEV